MEPAEGIEKVFSGEDYFNSLREGPKPEVLKAGFSQSGVSATNYEELKEERDKQEIFTKDKNLGKDDFLHLLTVQLRYQDPMNPMENTEFIAQMAQFSALEATKNVENAVTGLDDSFHQSLTVQQESADALKKSSETIENAMTSQAVTSAAMNNSMAASLAGKDVRVRVGQVLMGHDGSGNMKDKLLFFDTAGPADRIFINAYDKDDNLVRSMAANTGEEYKFDEYSAYKGYFKVKNENGDAVPPGLYRMEIEASLGGKKVDAYLFEQGKVGAVNFSADGINLDVKTKDWENGEKETTVTIPIGAVISVQIGDNS